jgi:lactoylglutathione lyase
MKLMHTCLRVVDPEASVRFYEALGFERRGRLNFETAYNLYLGLPGDGDTLELTVNRGRTEPYDLGDGYNHVALTVEDLDGLLDRVWADLGVEPEAPPYHPGGRVEYRICFVRDPDGYRIELIDGGSFPTPQDSALSAAQAGAGANDMVVGMIGTAPLPAPIRSTPGGP